MAHIQHIGIFNDATDNLDNGLRECMVFMEAERATPSPTLSSAL
jgi:hypothetical protein